MEGTLGLQNWSLVDNKTQHKVFPYFNSNSLYQMLKRAYSQKVLWSKYIYISDQLFVKKLYFHNFITDKKDKTTK